MPYARGNHSHMKRSYSDLVEILSDGAMCKVVRYTNPYSQIEQYKTFIKLETEHCDKSRLVQRM
jgi:hypothetical protein